MKGQGTNQNPETLPLMEDQSPEELRWGWLQANMNGQVQEYLASLQAQAQNQQNLRRARQNPDKPTANYIVIIIVNQFLIDYFR